MNDNQGRVARAAALVMLAFTISRMLGLVRQTVFSIYFGIGPEMDAYVAAARVQEAIFLIVAGGALGSAFIPLFTSRLTQNETKRAWYLASSIINLLLLILIPLIIVCGLLAPWLVRTLVAPAMPPALQERTVALMRVMLLSTVIFAVSGVVMGVLNAHQHFLLPAIAPIFYNLALIGGAVVGGMTGLGTMAPAIGMVIGSCLHLLVQIPGLMRYRARYTPALGLDDPGVRKVGQLLAPRVFGVAAVQINMVVSNSLASRLGAGAISALDAAWRVMLLPQGVFAQAVGTAAFPTLSALAARGEIRELRQTLLATLRTVIVITIPASVGLIALGSPIIAVMFQYGAFDHQATQDVAFALGIFSLGLVGHSAIEVLARTFYALQDTWSPAIAAAGAVGLNVVLGLALPPVFSNLGLAGFGGLALANALAALVETVILLVMLRPRLGGLDAARSISLLIKVLLASTGMACVLWLWLRFAPAYSWIQALIGLGLGVGTYVGLALLLRIRELRDLIRMVLHRR